jgi:peptidyl-prolyl cis-trans isomerase C
MARFLVLPLAVLTLLGCQKGGPDTVTLDLAPKGGGTPLAKFKGGAITVDDVNRQLATLPPMVKMRLQSPAAKKDFVEGQARVELLAREAIRNGLQNEPDVMETIKKALAQKALTQALEKNAPQPTDADVKAWYDNHQADFQRPEMVQLQDIFLSAEATNAARRKAREAEAQKIQAKARALKPDDEAGFAALAKASSDDALSKASGGDLRLMTLADLRTRYGAEVADAAKALTAVGQISPVVATDKGFHVLRLKALVPAHTLALDDVKAQIKSRLYSERRTAASDELLNRLKQQSGYTLDENAIAQLSVPAPTAPPGMPGGMPGMPAGMPGMPAAGHPPTPGAPAPGAPAAAPTPAPGPAPAR